MISVTCGLLVIVENFNVEATMALILVGGYLLVLIYLENLGFLCVENCG